MSVFERKISRRTAMMWVAASAPVVAGGAALAARAAVADWPEANWPRPDGPRYGNDADVFAPAPWPNLLDDHQRRTVAVLVDMIIPDDGISPSASEACVVDYVDEWVSSPYQVTQYHRTVVYNGIAWFDAESRRRFGVDYADAEPAKQLALFRDVYGKYAPDGSGFLRKVISQIDAKPIRIASAFLYDLHYLAVTAYYMTEAGRADIGYQGDRPSNEPYAGPTEDAKTHMRGVIASLGLNIPPELD